MDDEAKSTKPKPFVFVLMPFDPSFGDIYKFGIKGAAQDAGAYAERIDEQIFTEGILDRVFNQINKADVVVADMTGRNANVFYEVGYAHALGKIVLLLTQNADDIPFDLKHHQHTVYGGKIEILRKELTSKIEWAIAESKKSQFIEQKSPYEISIGDAYLPSGSSSEPAPLASIILANDKPQFLSLVIRNSFSRASESVSYIYLFTQQRSTFSVYTRSDTHIGGGRRIHPLKAHPSDALDELSRQYRLPANIPMLPPGASEILEFGVSVASNTRDSEGAENFRIRIHTSELAYDYPFKLEFQKKEAPERRKYSSSVSQ